MMHKKVAGTATGIMKSAPAKSTAAGESSLKDTISAKISAIKGASDASIPQNGESTSALRSLLVPPRHRGTAFNDPVFAKWRAHCYLLHIVLLECEKPGSNSLDQASHILPGGSWKFLSFRNRTKYAHCVDKFLASTSELLNRNISGDRATLLGDWKLYLGDGKVRSMADKKSLMPGGESLEASRVFVTQGPDDVWHLCSVWLGPSAGAAARAAARAANPPKAKPAATPHDIYAAYALSRGAMSISQYQSYTDAKDTKESDKEKKEEEDDVTPGSKPGYGNTPYQYTDPQKAIKMWQDRCKTAGYKGLTFYEPVLQPNSKLAIKCVDCTDALCIVCLPLPLPPFMKPGKETGRKMTVSDLKA